MIRIFYTTIVVFFLTCHSGYGQNFQLSKIDFYKNDSLINMPFIGGLSLPQVLQTDINLDGVEDLIIFDSNGEIFLPILRNDDETLPMFIYSPEYAQVFGKARGWVKIRDFDNDGIDDLIMFSREVGAPRIIEVRKGIVVNNSLKFEDYTINVSDQQYSSLHYYTDSEWKPILVDPLNLPEIIDIDFDGDLDLLKFNASLSKVEYYKNLKDEFPGSEDYFHFVLQDTCWGKFSDDIISNQFILSNNENECAFNFHSTSADLRHTNSSLTILDVDNDLQNDLLISSLLSPNAVFLKNSQIDTDWMDSIDYSFPSNEQSVQLKNYPAAYIADVDLDGLSDICFAPYTSGNTEDVKAIHYYKNVGTFNESEFALTNSNFINDMSIDLGTSTSPVIADVNMDGLKDIIIGTSGSFADTSVSYGPRLVLYENFGTINEPKFKLAENDLFGLSTFFVGLYEPSPTFCDIDNDGDQDLFVGVHTGEIFYFENIGVDSFLFASPVFPYMNIDIGALARPDFFDLDNDGDLDLLVGEQNVNVLNEVLGNINYFTNVGNEFDAFFEMDTDNHNPVFGGVNTRIVDYPSGKSSPRIIKSKNEIFLVTGSDRANIRLYGNIENNLDGLFELIFENWGGANVGTVSTCALEDLNNDGKYEMIVGNFRGGISIYGTDLMTNSTSVNDLAKSEFKLVPNPSSDLLRIEGFDFKRDNYLTIYNSVGMPVKTIKALEDQSIKDLKSGIYFIRAENYTTQKFVKF